MTPYRCVGCGNKTRFDVYVRRYSREFWHASLGGEIAVDEQETLESAIERVVCRWCGSTDVEGSADDPESAARRTDRGDAGRRGDG